MKCAVSGEMCFLSITGKECLNQNVNGKEGLYRLSSPKDIINWLIDWVYPQGPIKGIFLSAKPNCKA